MYADFRSKGEIDTLFCIKGSFCKRIAQTKRIIEKTIFLGDISSSSSSSSSSSFSFEQHAQ